MADEGLGPNGAMLFCMEYLEQNLDWLVDGLRGLEGDYFVFDVPGQVRRRRPLPLPRARALELDPRLTPPSPRRRAAARSSSAPTTTRSRASWRPCAGSTTACVLRILAGIAAAVLLR